MPNEGRITGMWLIALLFINVNADLLGEAEWQKSIFSLVFPFDFP